eukprot:3012634-Pleurochrysis_carterae.AAC.1
MSLDAREYRTGSPATFSNEHRSKPPNGRTLMRAHKQVHAQKWPGKPAHHTTCSHTWLKITSLEASM